MVTFLTSIRHPQNSKNFAKVEALFEMSLRSVCAQTDPNFRVMVVAHEIPRIQFTDSRVTYHLVDFPCPDPSPRLRIKAHFRDKGTKLIAGMLAARPFQQDYFAIFDADDFLSKRIAEFVNARPGSAGWYVDSGYVVNATSWTTQRKSGLNRFCGSTLIPSAAALYRIANISETTNTNLSQDEIVRLASPRVVDYVIGDHPYTVGYLASHGVQMHPLPFRATCWLLETGENYTKQREDVSGLPITDAICQEFGISAPPSRDRYASIAVRVREGLGSVRSRAGALRAGFNFPVPPSD